MSVVAASAVWLMGVAFAGDAGVDDGVAFFERNVRPLLIERCYECHSSESKEVQGGLRLDSRAGWEQGGDAGPAVAPGKPQESLLVKAVQYDDDDLRMPPKGKLPQAEIDVLVRWVAMGAPDPREATDAPSKAKLLDLEEGRRYWAFQPLAPSTPPSVGRPDWPRTPADAFVLARLESESIAPAPSAEPDRLFRRLNLDLLGLPPTVEEVRAFCADPRPDAFERAVDRLLASPRFGERWGRHWLDVARFAESFGFEHDYDRPYAFHYRDFVIRAFNADMPYDQFVRWQLAGDEFAPGDPEALAATGFLAAGVFPTQITANEVERTRYDALDDMLATAGSAFLGLSIGCARCHDHKFDPIPSREYYQMLATFTTTVRSEIDVDLDPVSTRVRWEAFEEKRRTLESELSRFEREVAPGRIRASLAAGGLRDDLLSGWTAPDQVEAKSEGGANITPQPDGSFLFSGENPNHDVHQFVVRTQASGVRRLRIEALADGSLVQGGPGRAPNGNFGLTAVRVQAAPAGDPSLARDVRLRSARATFEQKGLPASSVLKEGGGCWAVDPQFGRDHAIALEFDQPVGFDEGTILFVALEYRCNAQHSIGRPRLSISAGDAAPDLRTPIVSRSLASAARRLDGGADFDDLTDDERQALVERLRWNDPDWQDRRRALAEHLAQAPKPELTKMMVASEGVPPLRKHTQGADFFPETYVLKRGDVNLKDGLAAQGFLTVLTRGDRWGPGSNERSPEGARTSYRRLRLAEWATDVECGAGALAARVIVNRLWQHHLGRGIVATPNDFGLQGERPTHPELLEWLAGELTEGEWSLKRIHRLILSSAVYRQSSAGREDAAARDPDNRLLWRFQPRRLEAEPIRDSLLYVTGWLDTAMFGPGTLDEGQRRRSVYFTVKRSQLTPMLQLFDAPDASTSLGRRSQTTIAPQALVFLNDPHVRRWAEALGADLAAPPPAAAREGVLRAYERILGRPPQADEAEAAAAFLQPAASRGDADSWSAALADLTQVLFGSNEFVYLD